MVLGIIRPLTDAFTPQKHSWQLFQDTEWQCEEEAGFFYCNALGVCVCVYVLVYVCRWACLSFLCSQGLLETWLCFRVLVSGLHAVTTDMNFMTNFSFQLFL